MRKGEEEGKGGDGSPVGSMPLRNIQMSFVHWHVPHRRHKRILITAAYRLSVRSTVHGCQRGQSLGARVCGSVGVHVGVHVGEHVHDCVWGVCGMGGHSQESDVSPRHGHRSPSAPPGFAPERLEPADCRGGGQDVLQQGGGGGEGGGGGGGGGGGSMEG